MIRSVRSNNPNFKPVRFHSGFNVVLADRNRDNVGDIKHTRNGAGKTTLVEIIHFCLGAQVTKQSVFRNENLKGWSFILEIDIKNNTYFIERFTDCPGKIYIDGERSYLNLEFKYDKTVHRYYVSPGMFNKAMLEEFYGIEMTDANQQYIPSFRELLSYAIRRNVEGYKSAFEFFSRQKASSVQACNAYFLNLSMEYAAQFQSLKEKKKGIDDYKNAAKSGAIGLFNLNIGELSTEVITHQNDVDTLRVQLEAFQIHPQYAAISQEADSLTEQIHELINTRVIRRQLLERYENSGVVDAPDIPVDELRIIYEEAGVLFGSSILKPLSEVINFHESLVFNRKAYLHNEIISLKRELTELDEQIADLSAQRADLMKILETHGALEEYMLIQERYAQARQLLEDAKKRLEVAEFVEDSRSRLKIENQELLIKSRQDYVERSQMREQAISLFKSNTEFLYPEAGTLTIDLKESGYSFGIEMKNSRSQGVNYMKVFCYDMVVSELGSFRTNYPDFLVHDSTIFDGVDERQVARALMLAYMKCHEIGFQYICLINSDMVPYQEFDDEFSEEFDKSIVLRISDHQENGGLLGIRF